MKISQLGERRLVLRIRDTAGSGGPGVTVGIGDDCAVLSLSAGTRLLATTDLLLEDIHFRRSYAHPADIGWKALAVNLSDIAAMGGNPRFALVALGCPLSTEVEEIDAFYEGIRDAAAPHGVVIVGGDTSSSPDGWMVNMTLLGELTGPPRLRSDARVGDVIAVTGTLGESATGLALLEATGRIPDATKRFPLHTLDRAILDRVRHAHLRPVARVAEGRWLGASPAVHAMIDLSDGMATDLGHIVRESRVGARVYLDRLPISEAVKRVATALGRDPTKLAVAGGEDYELLLTVDPAAIHDLAAGLQTATGTPLTAVGEIVKTPVVVQFVDTRGAAVPMGEGFEHFSQPESR